MSEYAIQVLLATYNGSRYLAAFLDSLLAQDCQDWCLLVRDDCIIYEWYERTHSATQPHFSASMAKALVGGISVAVALSDGRLSLDGDTLATGDAAKVTGEVTLNLATDLAAELILIDVPLDFEPVGVWAGER